MSESSEKQTSRKRGKPLAFDRDRAVEAAMKLFWDRGYEGTSFDELIAAMGISPSSFYNSFGSKEELYRLTIEHYVNGPGSYFGKILWGEQDTFTAFRLLLERFAEEVTRDDLPAGCMISLSGAHMPPAFNSIREMMACYRALSDETLRERLKAGVDAGQLSPQEDLEELSSYFGTVIRGLSIQARDGRTREQLRVIGHRAMRAWPGESGPGA